MAYVEPTTDDFIVRFPEFAPVGEDTLAAVLAEAIASVGDTWLEKDRRSAQMYLAAHMLASEGEPYRSQEAASGGGGTAGGLRPVRSMRVGDVSVEYGGFDQLGNRKVSGSTSTLAWLSTTVYGERYLSLMRLSFPTALVV